jgi:TetR/AcrR family transcriptional regulator, transcriptional repressor for nem operon
LYGHFESKEDLSHASIDYLLAKMTERRNNALSKHTTARDKLFAFMDLNKNPLNPFFKGGCPIVNFSTETDDTNPIIKKKVRTMLTSAIAEFTQLLSNGVAGSEFSEKLVPEEFVVKMFMSIEGANALCRVLNSVKPMQTVIKSLKNELDAHLLI